PGRVPVFGGGVAVAGSGSQVRSESPRLTGYVRRGLRRHRTLERLERRAERSVVIAGDKEGDREREPHRPLGVVTRARVQDRRQRPIRGVLEVGECDRENAAVIALERGARQSLALLEL